jgi:hypothetical protein
MIQQQRFDRDGEYVQRYAGAGAGSTGPILDHAMERCEALARFSEARGRTDR